MSGNRPQRAKALTAAQVAAARAELRKLRDSVEPIRLLAGNGAVNLWHTAEKGTAATGRTDAFRFLLAAAGFRPLPAPGSWEVPDSRGRDSPVDLRALKARIDLRAKAARVLALTLAALPENTATWARSREAALLPIVEDALAATPRP